MDKHILRSFHEMVYSDILLVISQTPKKISFKEKEIIKTAVSNVRRHSDRGCLKGQLIEFGKLVTDGILLETVLGREEMRGMHPHFSSEFAEKK